MNLILSHYNALAKLQSATGDIRRDVISWTNEMRQQAVCTI